MGTIQQTSPHPTYAHCPYERCGKRIPSGAKGEPVVAVSTGSRVQGDLNYRKRADIVTTSALDACLGVTSHKRKQPEVSKRTSEIGSIRRVVEQEADSIRNKRAYLEREFPLASAEVFESPWGPEYEDERAESVRMLKSALLNVAIRHFTDYPLAPFRH